MHAASGRAARRSAALTLFVSRLIGEDCVRLEAIAVNGAGAGETEYDRGKFRPGGLHHLRIDIDIRR